MKKGRAKHKKPPLLHLSLGLGVALIATGWYWSGVRDFYSQTAQAAAALLGFGG
ncbi:MAG: hypothetical protein KA066_02530 [Candidatus Pacebacteria bacterium]|nr:hypothetical protein [Candidatus Paceibacterota bacterium]